KKALKSKKQIEIGKSGIEDDIKFHIDLTRASKNTILLKSIHIFDDILAESKSDYLQRAERRIILLEAYEGILLAVEQKSRI
ncbi:MAG: hypothetical protein ACFFAO_14980, partial [Candidatus Hermodarchaeota archaeon]